MAKNFGAGHLLFRSPFGECCRRFFQINAVEFNPLAVRLNEWPSLRCQPGDLGGREFNIVEHDRPADVTELVRTHDRVTGNLGEQSQGR